VTVNHFEAKYVADLQTAHSEYDSHL